MVDLPVVELDVGDDLQRVSGVADCFSGRLLRPGAEQTEDETTVDPAEPEKHPCKEHQQASGQQALQVRVAGPLKIDDQDNGQERSSSLSSWPPVPCEKGERLSPQNESHRVYARTSFRHACLSSRERRGLTGWDTAVASWSIRRRERQPAPGLLRDRPGMRILALCVAGTATEERAAMRDFECSVLSCGAHRSASVLLWHAAQTPAKPFKPKDRDEPTSLLDFDDACWCPHLADARQGRRAARR